LGSPLGKETVVIIGAVIDDHGSGGKDDLTGNLDIRYFPFGSPGKGGKVAVVVQEKMKFDGSFGLTEKSPVKKADRQIDDGRIPLGFGKFLWVGPFIYRHQWLRAGELSSRGFQDGQCPRR